MTDAKSAAQSGAAKAKYTFKELDLNEKSQPVVCSDCKISAPPGSKFCNGCGLQLKETGTAASLESLLNTIIPIDSLIWCAKSAAASRVTFPWGALLDPKSEHFGLYFDNIFEEDFTAMPRIRTFHNLSTCSYNPDADYPRMTLGATENLPSTHSSKWRHVPLMAHLGVPNIAINSCLEKVMFGELLRHLIERNICDPQSGRHRVGLVTNFDQDRANTTDEDSGPIADNFEAELRIQKLDTVRYASALEKRLKDRNCGPHDELDCMSRQNEGVAGSEQLQKALDGMLAQLPPVIYHSKKRGRFYDEAAINKVLAPLRATFAIELKTLTVPQKVGPCTVRVAGEPLEALLDAAEAAAKTAMVLAAVPLVEGASPEKAKQILTVAAAQK